MKVIYILHGLAVNVLFSLDGDDAAAADDDDDDDDYDKDEGHIFATWCVLLFMSGCSCAVFH